MYGGGQPLSRVKQNSRLQNWFSDREKQVKTLDLADPAAAARLAVQISVAITEALEFDQIESNLQVGDMTILLSFRPIQHVICTR